MKLSYFGRLADLAGTSAENMARPSYVTTIGALILWLDQARPELAKALRHSGVRAIVHDDYAAPETPLADSSEISFVPPVSGG